MSELRFDPVLREWVIVATSRQERPLLPKDVCPFCPGSGKVPDSYDVYIYPNDFSSLSIPPPEITVEVGELRKAREASGVCDVVLYSPDHNLTFADLPVAQIEKIVRLWKKRFEELARMKEIKYVFIFENKGEVIGVTIPHPHGQIYAFPFIPPRPRKELNSSWEYWRRKKKCLFCKIMKDEKKNRKRLVTENSSFISFVPFYAKYPYEVHIYSKRHIQTLLQFTEEEEKDLAHILKVITKKYDNLFGFSSPYMMVLHQAPVDNKDYSYYHFHIEFYPPYRAKDKLKFRASCETGAGTFINDTSPEEKAEEMRRAKGEE
ncbi:MAG: galactose-1-phosphate uridylyltransferase [candidate division WOR-3 bacterium]|nr:galactose-1-phosphate uridylyltransferase [candidate division WOR-3 bacterium]